MIKNVRREGNTTKQIKMEDIKGWIETIRNLLKKNCLTGWAYLHSQKLSQEQIAAIQMVWPRLDAWKEDMKLLQAGQEEFEYRIEKQLNEVRKTELKKLCKELFG